MDETTTEAIVQNKSKKPLIFLGILFALVLAIYLALCGIAANTDTFYPNSFLNGADIGGLSAAQAGDAFRQELTAGSLALFLDETGDTPDATLSFVDLGLSAQNDYAGLAAIAYADLQGKPFLFKGAEYFRHLLWEQNYFALLDWDEAQMTAKTRQAAKTLSRAPLDAAYQLKTNCIAVTAAKDGRRISASALTEQVSQLLHGDIGPTPSLLVPVSVLTAKTLTAQALHDEVAGEMKNAGYDPETKSITPERIGAEFDVPAAQTLLDAAVPGETVELPAALSFPAVTADTLKQVLFRDVLGTYTTHVGGSAGRIGNVKLSAGKVDGFIMNSGEIFSYNDVVGERTAANGYQPAPAYVKGETVDEIGGGICQTSSTLYYAALLSNLEIVERYAHRYAPAYIAWGMDATVSWGGPEFRFRNDTDYPVKLVTNVSKKNYLTITVYGTKTEDFKVKMTNKVLSDTPFETIRKDDPTLPIGTETVKITPYTGHKVEAYRNVYGPDGKLVSSKLESVSDYKVRNKLILVGPPPAIVPETPPEEIPGELPSGADTELPADGNAEIPGADHAEVPQEPVVPKEPALPPLA